MEREAQRCDGVMERGRTGMRSDRDEEQQGKLRAAVQGQSVPVPHLLPVLLSLQLHQPLQAEENQTEPQTLIQYSL